MNLRILLIFTLLTFAFSSKADRIEAIDYNTAVQLKNHLLFNAYMLEYCDCCSDANADLIHILYAEIIPDEFFEGKFNVKTYGNIVHTFKQHGTMSFSYDADNDVDYEGIVSINYTFSLYKGIAQSLESIYLPNQEPYGCLSRAFFPEPRDIPTPNEDYANWYEQHIGNKTPVNPLSIVELYRKIENPAIKYFPINNNNQITTANNELDIDVKSVVDIENGYIEIDILNEAGTATHQVALFVTSGGRSIVAVKSSYNAEMYRQTEFCLLEYWQGWTDISSQRLPDLPVEKYIFSKEKMPEFDHNELARFIEFIVPQQGTTLKTSVNKNDLQNYCSATESTLCNIIDFIKNDVFSLSWNKYEGKFELKK